MSAAVLTLVLAGCGSGATTGGTAVDTSAPTVSSSEPSTKPSAGGVHAVTVTYRRAGGRAAAFAQSMTVTAGDPPDGHRRHWLRTVLSAASDPALRQLKLPPLPSTVCCDRYVYTLAVTWSDGTSRIFRTADGVAQPPALRHLLHALASNRS